jgi:hypothetical protein
MQLLLQRVSWQSSARGLAAQPKSRSDPTTRRSGDMATSIGYMLQLLCVFLMVGLRSSSWMKDQWWCVMLN